MRHHREPARAGSVRVDRPDDPGNQCGGPNLIPHIAHATCFPFLLFQDAPIAKAARHLGHRRACGRPGVPCAGDKPASSEAAFLGIPTPGSRFVPAAGDAADLSACCAGDKPASSAAALVGTPPPASPCALGSRAQTSRCAFAGLLVGAGDKPASSAAAFGGNPDVGVEGDSASGVSFDAAADNAAGDAS